jgi:hypothetical protein
MDTDKNIITEDSKLQKILSFFHTVEGMNTVYYGKVRNGKTYSATADIWELLDRGEIVYANWLIKWPGYDERQQKVKCFLKMLVGQKTVFHYLPENFHYFSPDDIDVAFLGKLVGVHLFIDEGQWLFNSQVRHQDDEKRKLILHGGHYCRTLNVITQRTTNVFKDIRSQINIWYKVEKKFTIGSLIMFQRWEFQEMKNDEPDEEKPEGHPKTYFGRKKIFQSYDTHGMRSADAIEPDRAITVFEFSRKDFMRLIFGRK